MREISPNKVLLLDESLIDLFLSNIVFICFLSFLSSCYQFCKWLYIQKFVFQKVSFEKTLLDSVSRVTCYARNVKLLLCYKENLRLRLRLSLAQHKSYFHTFETNIFRFHIQDSYLVLNKNASSNDLQAAREARPFFASYWTGF